MDYLAEIAKTKLPFEPVDLPLAKRIFDIVMACLLLLVLLPIILAIQVIFYLEEIFVPSSRGPLIYSETRISKRRPFTIFKFRIFKIVSAGNYFKAHGYVDTKTLENNEDNLTFTGKILKQIYMDELPQLFNVLKGDMTLVGPRPSNPVVTWQDGQAGKFQRYLFTCGLTGPFQTFKDAKIPRDQNQMDMDYILFCKNNPGFKVAVKDLKILWDTVLTVLRAKGV